MKNPFLLSSLMFLVLVFMPSCGLQSDESHTNDNIVSESLDLLPSVSDESAALDAPEWVAWLANSWGDNSGEWMSEAECDGKTLSCGYGKIRNTAKQANVGASKPQFQPSV